MPPARLAFWAATTLVIVPSIRAVLVAPPSFVTAAVCATAYFALLLCGVFVLRLRMFADAIVRGPDGARGVALTFDDGPDPVHTRHVLDVLDAQGAKATFFVIGRKAEAHPDVVREILQRGHEVGVHGFAHDRLFAMRGSRRVREDLNRAVRTLENITGQTPKLFRPPIGHTNPTIARVADDLDLTVVGWSIGALDGLSRTRTEDVVARVGRGLRDGAIVLLHDAAEHGERKPAAVDALPQVLKRIEAENLQVVPLSSWLT